MYNSAGQVIRQTDQFGTPTYTLYDVDGRVVETRTATKDENGNDRWLVTRTAYDVNGQVEATTDPYVVSNTNAPTSLSFSIDGDTVLSPLRTTQTIYDPAGRAIETRRLAGIGITLADPGGLSVPGIFSCASLPALLVPFLVAAFAMSFTFLFCGLCGPVVMMPDRCSCQAVQKILITSEVLIDEFQCRSAISWHM